MEKPKLTLLKRPQDLPAANNFWRCCPLSKEYLPETHCPEGEPRVVRAKIQDEPKCQWWINSGSHNFCFWRFIRDKSDSDGMMKELVQTELAELFGWSNTKTHFMLKQAISELTEALNAYGAAELLQDIDAGDQDLPVNLGNLTDQSHEDPLE